MGKASKRRNCPVAGREITPVECGTKRGTLYDCPVDCPFCPWSPENYDDFLDIEGRIDKEVLSFYESQVGLREFQNQFAGIHQQADEEGDDFLFAMQEVCIREFHLRDFGAGKNLFDLWRECGWKGLSRDEPFLAFFKARSRLALLEVRRVVDDQTVECVDLLGDAPKPLLICDRGLAAQATPFAFFLGWICAYPFFHRLHGVASPLPNSVESARERVLKMVVELGGPAAPGSELNAWLAGNFRKLVLELNRKEKNRMRSAVRNADFKECLAVYRWRDGVRDLKLQGRPDFVLLPEDPHELKKSGPHGNYVWLRVGKSAKREESLPKIMRSIPGMPGEPVWGHLRVFPDRVEVVATAAVLFRPMREMVEEFFADTLVFEKEFVADLAKQKFPSDSDDTEQKIVQTSNFFREQPSDMRDVLKQSMQARLRHVLDDEVPALDGLTPREASRRPGSRPMLVDWMKGYIGSLETLGKQEGIIFDFDSVLDELGLPELKIARTKPTYEISAHGWWRVLDLEDVKAFWKKPEEAHLADLGVFPGIEEYFESIDEDLLNEAELDALFNLADFTVGLLVPEDIQPTPIQGETMRRKFTDLLDEFSGEADESLEETPRKEDPEEMLALFEGIISRSPQPVLLMTLAMMLADFEKEPGQKSEIRKDNRFPILLQLEALIRSIRDVAV